jgi:hypothetical protein
VKWNKRSGAGGIARSRGTNISVSRKVVSEDRPDLLDERSGASRNGRDRVLRRRSDCLDRHEPACLKNGDVTRYIEAGGDSLVRYAARISEFDSRRRECARVDDEDEASSQRDFPERFERSGYVTASLRQRPPHLVSQTIADPHITQIPQDCPRHPMLLDEPAQ